MNRLRELRDTSGKKLEAVAAHVGVSWRTILRWEMPDFDVTTLSVKTAERLAEVLGASVDTVLGR